MPEFDASRYRPGANVRLTGPRGKGDTYIVLTRYSNDEYRLENKYTGAVVRAYGYELTGLGK